MSNENWYIAEFVIAVDFDGGEPHEYRIETFVIKAITSEEAYEKSQALLVKLNGSLDNGFGEIENYVCLGFHNLSEHHDANNGEIVHINTIDLVDVSGNPPKPRIRGKNELYLFL